MLGFAIISANAYAALRFSMEGGNEKVPRVGKTDSQQRILEVLRDILITELGRASVPQLEIRRIVGVDIARVNRIVRFMKPRKG